MGSTTVPGAVDAVGAATAGGVLLWRFEPFVERSMEASTAHSPWSPGYGLAAQVVPAFGGVYLASRQARIRVPGWSAGGLGAMVGVVLLSLTGVVGFTVVGRIIAALRGMRNRLAGRLVGPLVAGAAAFVDPLVVGPV